MNIPKPTTPSSPEKNSVGTSKRTTEKTNDHAETEEDPNESVAPSHADLRFHNPLRSSPEQVRKSKWKKAVRVTNKRGEKEEPYRNPRVINSARHEQLSCPDTIFPSLRPGVRQVLATERLRLSLLKRSEQNKSDLGSKISLHVVRLLNDRGWTI